MTNRQATLFLMHAHDHIWNNRKIDLGSRVQSCQLIMELVTRIIETNWRKEANGSR